MTFIKTDVSGAIATHAAIKQNVHGVGANDIADVADIATHAGVTTNVHGTGAGNVIVGNDEITGLMNKTPDYDSGCISVNATSYVVKTHNLNTRKLLVIVMNSLTDNDCIADGTSGAGRPMHALAYSDASYKTFSSSVNALEFYNGAGGTRWFRILIWKAD